MAAIFENDLKYSVDDFEVRKDFYNRIGIKDAKFIEYNTEEEIDHTIKAVTDVVTYLRNMSPVWRDLMAGKREFILK